MNYTCRKYRSKIDTNTLLVRIQKVSFNYFAFLSRKKSYVRIFLELFTVSTIKSGLDFKRRLVGRHVRLYPSRKNSIRRKNVFSLGLADTTRGTRRNFKHLTQPRVSNHKQTALCAFTDGWVNSQWRTFETCKWQRFVRRSTQSFTRKKGGRNFERNFSSLKRKFLIASVVSNRNRFRNRSSILYRDIISSVFEKFRKILKQSSTSPRKFSCTRAEMTLRTTTCTHM